MMVSDTAEVPWNSLSLVGRTVAGNATLWKLFSREPMPGAWLGMMFEKGRLLAVCLRAVCWLTLFELPPLPAARHHTPDCKPALCCVPALPTKCGMPMSWLLPCRRLRSGGSQGVGCARGLSQVSRGACGECTCILSLEGIVCWVAGMPAG